MSSLLERGIKVLELLAGHPEGVALSAVASATDMPLSATHRLLAELVRLGYVRQLREQGDYVLTIRLVSLGLSYLSASGMVDVAQPLLDALAETSRELVRLAIVDGDELVFVAKSQGATRGLRYDPDMGLAVRLSCSAAGHALLSTMSDEQALELRRAPGIRRPQRLRAARANRRQAAARLRAQCPQARLRHHRRGVRAGHGGDGSAGAAVERPGDRRRDHRRADGAADAGAHAGTRVAAGGHGAGGDGGQQVIDPVCAGAAVGEDGALRPARSAVPPCRPRCAGSGISSTGPQRFHGSLNQSISSR